VTAPWVLGLAASHNGAACLLHGDRVVAAIQEERLTRVKCAPLVPSQPFRALDYVLEAGGIQAADLDRVVLCPLQRPSNPSNDLDRHPTLAGVPRAIIPHHLGHAIGAYASSGFQDAAICVIDAMGSCVDDLPPDEQAVIAGHPTDLERPDAPGCEARELISFYEARSGRLVPLEKRVGGHDPFDPKGDLRPRMMNFVGLGVMYMSVAQQVFGHWTHSGKLMGLAPCAEADLPIENFLRVDDGHLSFSDAVAERFRHDRRWPEDHAAYTALAASCQRALEAGLEAVWDRLRGQSTSRRLCYAGGVALNSVANERLIQSARFDEVFIMPAAEDCGTALGAAFHGLWSLTGPRPGPGLSTDFRGVDHGVGDPSQALIDEVAKRLEAGQVVGWFQGASEFGPRALGHRSLLLDPRRADGQAHLNARVKHREAFRPFAPVVLEEHAAAWFELGEGPSTSPFMLRVVPVRAERRAQIPAVTHVDGSARLQTVSSDGDPALRALLTAFHARTGVPLLLNTSFNVRGEPLVETPEDALACFDATAIDCLVLGERLISRS